MAAYAFGLISRFPDGSFYGFFRDRQRVYNFNFDLCIRFALVSSARGACVFCGLASTGHRRLSSPNLPTGHRTKMLSYLLYGIHRLAFPLFCALGRSIASSHALFREALVLSFGRLLPFFVFNFASAFLRWTHRYSPHFFRNGEPSLLVSSLFFSRVCFLASFPAY